MFQLLAGEHRHAVLECDVRSRQSVSDRGGRYPLDDDVADFGILDQPWNPAVGQPVAVAFLDRVQTQLHESIAVEGACPDLRIALKRTFQFS